MTYLEKNFRQHAHRYFVDSETRDEVCLCGAIKGEKRRGNKYNAKPTVYNNDRFDSQFEANYAAELDLLIRSSQVKGTSAKSSTTSTPTTSTSSTTSWTSS
jgi:hypothetical protein